MNISPVSFSAAQSTTSFQDKIRQPQAFVTQEAPAASSKIKNDGEKKKSPAKIVAGLVVAAGVIAAGLGIGAKKGVFAPGKNEALNTVKSYLDKAGSFIADNAVKAKDWVVSKLPQKTEQAAEAAAETAGKAAEKAEAVKDKVVETVEKAVENM